MAENQANAKQQPQAESFASRKLVTLYPCYHPKKIGYILKSNQKTPNKQVCLYSINHNEMKMKMKMKNRSHGYDINRPRPRHGHNYSKYRMSHYHDA